MVETRRKKVSVRRSPLKTMHTKAMRVAARMNKVRAAPEPTADDLVSLSRPERTAGRGKAVPSTSFTKAERRQVTDDRSSPVEKAPHWVYALISRGASRKREGRQDRNTLEQLYCLKGAMAIEITISSA